MKELSLGIMPLSELADWFGVKRNTLSHSKEKKLQELKEFCEFEDLGRKGVNIKVIYIPTYSKFTKDIEIYKDVVKGQPNHLTSVSLISKTVRDKEEYKDMGERTIAYRMTKAGNIGFGVTKEEGSKGIFGSREYIWAIKLDNGPVFYRYFSEDEKKLFDELTSNLYAENPEKIQKLALLDESLKGGELEVQEYFEKRELLGLNVFSEVIYQFKQKTGLTVVRATQHHFENNFGEE